MATVLTTGTWKLDSDHSEISMNVRHAGIARVRGNFNEASSTIEVNEGNYTLDVSIKSESFDSNSKDRDVHVKGEDFLDVENYPELTFSSTGTTPFGKFFDLEGELTLRGTKRRVVFDVEYGGAAVDPFGMQRVGFIASATISRREFGLEWNAVLDAGGVLVGDKVNIDLAVSYVFNE